MRLTGYVVLFATLCSAQTAQGPLDSGTSEFKQGHYAQAVQFFQEAATGDPNNVTAHLYLGTALQMQFVPGLDSRENAQFADGARGEFQKVLSLDARNELALASLATLAYNERHFDEAKDWNRKVIEVDPGNKEAYYTLGVIGWTEWLPVDRQARKDSGQKPEDVGPIANARLRNELKAKWLPILDEAMKNEETALRIDADYSDAMAYLNLVIRYRADLLDTLEEWKTEVRRADEWVTRASEAKKAAGTGARARDVMKIEAPASAGAAPGTLRIGGRVAQANLESQVAPMYPPRAKQARISGTVRFNAVIGKDGHVDDLALISGHPLLVQAAKEAVQQWVYKPTLLNGEPVQVLTTVEVNFSLLP